MKEKNNALKPGLEQVREAALRLLDVQDRTVAEMRERLQRKDFDDAVIESVLLSFQNAGLLDDVRYAECFVRDRMEGGRGSRWIREKLRKKGIPPEIIAGAMDALSDETDETRRCMEKALAVCGLAGRYCVTSDREFVSLDDAEIQEPERYFYRLVDGEETDRQVIYKGHEKAKNRLARRLLSAGFPSGAVMETIRKIDML